MPKKYKKITGIILVLLIFQVGLIYTWLNKENTKLLDPIKKAILIRTKEKTDIKISHKSYYQKKSFYDEAYVAGREEIILEESTIYGGIIPHHLMPKDKIAAWFMGIEDKNYETVILIGPNHYDAGNGNMILSQAKWQTPYGELMPDIEISDKLLQNKLVQVDEEPFYIEHSISGLVPFVKKSIPNAKIVPIILKFGVEKNDLDVLVNQITSIVDIEKTLIISSVDFSHYQSAHIADFHDQLSKSVIEDFDLPRIQSLEIDSPASIYTLLSYLKNIKKEKAQLVFHTNSSYLINRANEPGTSHFGYYFLAGEPSTQKTANLLFFGDMMLDRHVKNVLEEKNIDFILEDIAGDENRFFMGSDIVSANLEGAVTNNGQHYDPELTNDFAINPYYIKELRDKYFFNFFNLANNHISDQNHQGVNETTQNLKNLTIQFSGCLDSLVDNCSATSIKSGNTNIALAGFSMVYHDFDINKAKEKIRELKSKNNIVVVQIHWGNEYEHEFNEKQQNIAHHLIDAGADTIIGHHPHVVQGMEIYKNKSIFYSLGNFIFDQYFSEDTQEQLSIGISYNKQNDTQSIYLFPIKSKDNKLHFMSDEEENIFLDKFISWSQLKDQYKNSIKSKLLEL